MGFLDFLRPREKRPAFEPTTGGIASSDPYLMRILGYDRGGRNIASPDEALSALAVAGRCVSLIAEGLAAIPLRVHRIMDDGGSELAPTHPLDGLLNSVANDDTTAFRLREGFVRDVAMHGNGFLRQEIDGRGRASALHYLPWGMTGVERLATGRLRYRYTNPYGGLPLVLTQDEVCHARYATRDGVIGVSPLEWSGTAIGLAVAQTGLAQTQVDRGFTPDIAFETGTVFGTGEMADTAFRRLKQQISERLGKLSKDGSPLLLEAGLKANTLSASGREAQFHESRMAGLADVARIYGVPLSVVGLGDNASYGSLSEESLALVQNCFTPWARRIETELQRVLLTADGRQRFEIRHDLSGLMRGDMAKRFQVYTAGIQSEILSPNECRRMEGWASRPGGDAYRNPSTTGTGDRAGKPNPPGLRGSAADAQPAEA